MHVQRPPSPNQDISECAHFGDKGKVMAEDYHSFFIERKGEGENKDQALQSFLE